MPSYTKEQLDSMLLIRGPFIIETKYRNTYIGYFVKDENIYQILPLDITKGLAEFIKPSSIKRIINFNGYVYPKDKSSKKDKMLNLFELNDLVNKAGYKFI